jgi:hypothetical protein
MWPKPEENKPQSALDALPSTVPSPQRPAAAVPRVSPNAPSWVTSGIKIKGEISGREDLFLDGAFEGKIHIADGSFTVGLNARVNAEIEAREIIVRGEVIGTLKAGERVQIWRRVASSSKRARFCAAKSNFVKKTSRRSLLARRFPRTPKKPLPRIRRRPNNRRRKRARGERYEGRKNIRDHDQSK